MAVQAIDVNKSTDPVRLCVAAAVNLRAALTGVQQAFAGLDALRDGGSVGPYFATKVGGTEAEAAKLFDEMNSLNGKVSFAPDTIGAAVNQFCAKLGV